MIVGLCTVRSTEEEQGGEEGAAAGGRRLSSLGRERQAEGGAKILTGHAYYSNEELSLLLLG